MTDNTTNRILYDDAQRLMSRIKWAERALDDAKRAIGDKTPLSLTLPLLDAANQAVEEARDWLRGANDRAVETTPTEELQALERGISVAETQEDLSRCADTLRSWQLPKGVPTVKKFAHLLLERAKALGLEPRKSPEPLPREPGCEEEEPVRGSYPGARVKQEQKSRTMWDSYEPKPGLPRHELQDGYPRIVNAPRPPNKKLIDEAKSQREVLKSMVSMAKMGLDEEEGFAIDALAEELLCTESQKALKELYAKVDERAWSADALSRINTLFRTRHEHLAVLGGAK